MSLELIWFCLANQIGNIIICYNVGWKIGQKVSKKFRRDFYPIPFMRLMHMTRYKAEAVGIEFKETEKSYTSQDCGLCGVRHRKSVRKM